MAQALPRREYDNLIVLLERGTAGSYPVSILSDCAGQARTQCSLDPGDAWLQQARVLLASGDADEPFLARLGCALFERLFAGDGAACLRSALARARERNRGLRLRLNIQPAELATLPWEFLYDPSEDVFLGQSPETPISRYAGGSGALRIEADGRALRVLVAVSSPKGLSRLNVAREYALIEDAVRTLAGQGALELSFCEHADPDDIRRALRRSRPQVLHFTGYGYGAEDALLFLENEDGQGLAMDTQSFAGLLSESEPTRLLVLNVRDTANLRRQKLEGSFPLLMRLAPGLLQAPIQGVVAVPGAMNERAARMFTRDFYHDLARGFGVDAALADARRGMALGGAGAQWGRPVSFI